MAKKKVEVNEDMLKDIMVGDIPVFGRERPNYQEPKVIETEDSDTDSDEGTEAVASKPSTPKPRKKREETGTYKERYLVNIPASNRSHVYINREVADCIVNALPREYKIPFSMHVSGFKYREIAEKLGLPLGTVKSRIFFTRQRLQQELKDFV